MNVIYEGFFIMDKINSKLAKDIEFKHITTEFRPTKTHEHLYGTMATFAITGYANDSINEGCSVTLKSCDNDELVDLFNNISVPHITLSVSNEGKPVNTKNLNFKDEFNDNTIVHAVFGGFVGKPILQSN